VYFFAGLFTFTTYLLAGWAREQVCTYMCPWPRFQSAMLDDQSFTVTYQGWRGEPRSRGKRHESGPSVGDCVDRGACVTACPTGIDICDGIQMSASTAACASNACNHVMERTHQDKWLITRGHRSKADREKGAAARGDPAHSPAHPYLPHRPARHHGRVGHGTADTIDRSAIGAT
jgi:polyferredoxin